MSSVLQHYLESIRHNIGLDVTGEREIIHELETHIEDRLQELEKAGLSRDEAVKTCSNLLGSAKLAARQIYQAHSQGTWKQTLLASMPHFLFGILFALNWWQYIGWLSTVVALVFATTVYGWWRGKPTWVFPWLGYSLLPVIVVGILLLYLPRGWSLLTLLLYFPMALWWLYYIIAQTAKRDWLLSSVMLLPLPIIIGWFLTVAPGGRFNEYSVQRVHDFALWIGLSFLILALTIAAFIRLRQRWLRISLLIVSGILTLTVIGYYTYGRLSLSTLIGLILIMWGLFLIPPLLERWGRKRMHRFKSEQGKVNHHEREVTKAESSGYH
ncbi:hypothetical protein ACFLVB_05595 [Chloroflexota bacterium]